MWDSWGDGGDGREIVLGWGMEGRSGGGEREKGEVGGLRLRMNDRM